MKDECGIFGIYSNDTSKEVSSLIYYGLYALQHRGQESAGISTFDGKDTHSYREMGLLVDVFSNFDIEDLKGYSGIGHVRYSTSGASLVENCQPFRADFAGGTISISHNGEIINHSQLKDELEADGVIFHSTSDSEVICHLVSRECVKTENVMQAIENVCDKLQGAYSLIIQINEDIYVVRDPNALKPCVLGKLDDTFTIAASETVGLDVLGAEYIRDLKPGEILRLTDKLESRIMEAAKTAIPGHCVFEYVYFARSDSVIDGKSVYQSRKNAGKILAQKFPADVDVVMAVPDSSISAAIGYAKESGIRYGEGLMKNRYVGRTFIMPTQEVRELAVKLKMNPIVNELKGKKIVLVDDSIVRGTTSKGLIKIIKAAGAKEVHLRIACPPVISPCFYGVAMASKEELIAANHSVDEIAEMLGVDSLGYIPLDDLVDAVGIPRDKLCMGCLTEEYPTEVPER